MSDNVRTDPIVPAAVSPTDIGIIAKRFRQLASSWRELAMDLKSTGSRGSANLRQRAYRLRDQCGNAIVMAWRRGLLHTTRGLPEVMAWYESAESEDEKNAGAQYVRCPANVFNEFVGHHSIRVQRAPDGNLTSDGQPFGGIIPTMYDGFYAPTIGEYEEWIRFAEVCEDIAIMSEQGASSNVGRSVVVSDAQTLMEFSDALKALSSDIDTLHEGGTGPHDRELAEVREQVIRSARVLHKQVQEGMVRDALDRQGMLSGERKDGLAQLAVALDFIGSTLRASIANGWGYRITGEDQSASAEVVQEWDGHWHTVRHTANLLAQWASAMSPASGEAARAVRERTRAALCTDDLETQRRSLTQVRQRIADIDYKAIGSTEAHRQLEIHQQAVMRIVQSTHPDSPLGRFADGSGERDLLPAWERLSRRLEADHPDVLRVDDISDARLPLLGENRALHISPPDRVGVWIEHALSVVDALLKIVRSGPGSSEQSESNGNSGKQDTTTIPTDLITYAAASALVPCSERTISRRVKEGVLTPYGDPPMVSQADVKAKRPQLSKRRHLPASKSRKKSARTGDTGRT